MLGEAFDAKEAHRVGIVNRVLPAAEVDPFALAQAAKHASGREIAVQMTEEAAQFGKMLLAPEAKEAFKAFFEKRKPDFRQFD